MDKIDPQLIDAIMGDYQTTAKGSVTCTPGCPCPEDCDPCDCDLAEKQAENVGQSNTQEASRLIYNALREARERAEVDAVIDEVAAEMISRLEAFKGACDIIDSAASGLKRQAYETIFSNEPIPDEIDVHLEVHIPVNSEDELPLSCRNLFIKTGPGTTLNFVGEVGDVDITAATGTVVSFEQDVVGDVTIVQGDGSDVNIERVDKNTDIEIEQGIGSHVTIESTED